MLRSIIQDVKYAARQGRRAPEFAFTVHYRLVVSVMPTCFSCAMVAAGLLIGSTLTWFVAQFAGSYIYGVRAHDTLTFVAVAIVLAASSLFAAWLPARRAAAVDSILCFEIGVTTS